MALKIGDSAPNFSLPNESGQMTSLSSLRGKKVVLYFYPKADTSGCTAQACGFRDAITQFRSLSANIIGISKDEVGELQKFKAKYNLNFPLLSDAQGRVCEEYGTWAQKSMYGRLYMGIERTTFLIDENGVIQNIWSKVVVPGHVAEVAAALGSSIVANSNSPSSSKKSPAKKAAKKKTKSKKSAAKKAVKKSVKKPAKKKMTRKKSKRRAA